MDISLSTWMMLFFIFSLIIAIWKIYVFLPTKVLEDDDTTEEATEILNHIMLESAQNTTMPLTEIELFEAMKKHKDFDTKKFWRFNQNKLKNLLEHYHLQNNTRLI